MSSKCWRSSVRLWYLTLLLHLRMRLESCWLWSVVRCMRLWSWKKRRRLRRGRCKPLFFHISFFIVCFLFVCNQLVHKKTLFPFATFLSFFPLKNCVVTERQNPIVVSFPSLFSFLFASDSLFFHLSMHINSLAATSTIDCFLFFFLQATYIINFRSFFWFTKKGLSSRDITVYIVRILFKDVLVFFRCDLEPILNSKATWGLEAPTECFEEWCNKKKRMQRQANCEGAIHERNLEWR